MAGPETTPNPARRPAVRTDAELRRLIRADPRTPGRETALADLVERAPRGLTRTLTSVALDDALDTPIRLQAVGALAGRSGLPTRSALEALRSLTSDTDVAVARRAIERLGKVGGADDLAALRAVRTSDRSTLRTVRAAQCFLSYRHRLGKYRVDQPKRRLAAGASAEPLTAGAPTKRLRERFELRAAAVPGVDLMSTPARRVECGSTELALLLNREIVDDAQTVATLSRQQAVAGVITRYNIETGTDEPRYYLLTDPVRGARFGILGVSESGRVGLAGAGVVERDIVSFEVNATDQPLDHPLTVRGSYSPADGAVRFDVALSDAGFSDVQQSRRRQPTLDPG